jgi:hypothetical protein
MEEAPNRIDSWQREIGGEDLAFMMHEGGDNYIGVSGNGNSVMLLESAC